MDLINRQAAIDALGEEPEVWFDDDNGDYDRGMRAQWRMDVSALKALQSAEPEIIRCRDCKYAHLTHSGDCKYCDNWLDDDDFHLTLHLDGDFYCGYAEPKEEGEEE